MRASSDVIPERVDSALLAADSGPQDKGSKAKHYKSKLTVTEVEEYEGFAHLLPAPRGWEEIADHAREWAVEHAGWWTG